jgi:hypothetical protein
MSRKIDSPVLRCLVVQRALGLGGRMLELSEDETYICDVLTDTPTAAIVSSTAQIAAELPGRRLLSSVGDASSSSSD